MPSHLYKVKFSMGENATDSNPAIEAGQIILDTAQDKECVFVDINDTTRLQVKDPTKMDKWGEVHSYGDQYTLVEPSTPIFLGHTIFSGATPSMTRGLAIDNENGIINLGYIDGRSDETDPHQVYLSMDSTKITGTYHNTEQDTVTLDLGYSSSGGLNAGMSVDYDRSNTKYGHSFGISSSDDSFRIVSMSHTLDTFSYNKFNLMVCPTYLSIDYGTYTLVTQSISFLPDTDTEQFLIHGVCSPKEDIDAANKQYVDQVVSEVKTSWVDW